MDIYELEWTDRYGTYRVCPECHGELDLVYESENGERQEWHCEQCWHSFDENDRNLGKIHWAGMGALRCPECGDHRVARDGEDDCYYCRNCKTTYRDVKIETWMEPDGLTRDGTPRGKIVDFGPPEHPETCPNCGDPLRRQWYDLPGGKGAWAYYCRYCDIVYLDDYGKLVVPPRCPKCGGYALDTFTRRITNFKVWPLQHREERFQLCGLCRTKFDLGGDYWNDADRPTHGNRQIPKSVLGFVSRSSNSVKPQ